jgi:hypothetical protein
VHSFYRGARVLRSGARVDHGATFLDGEGARRGAHAVAGIRAMLKDLLAQRKEEGKGQYMEVPRSSQSNLV